MKERTGQQKPESWISRDRTLSALPGTVLQHLNRTAAEERNDKMSVKIRVSYTDEEELLAILKRLQPYVDRWKIAKQQKGAYKNAYIVMK